MGTKALLKEIEGAEKGKNSHADKAGLVDKQTISKHK